MFVRQGGSSALTPKFLGASPSCSHDSPSYVIPTPVCELRYRLEVGYRYLYQSQQLPLSVKVFFFLGVLQDPSQSASKSSKSNCKAAAMCTWKHSESKQPLALPVERVIYSQLLHPTCWRPHHSTGHAY